MARLKSVLFLFIPFSVLLVLYAFHFPDDQAQGEIFVEGQVFYNFSDPLYQGLFVEGKIYEDGKLYKKFTCTEKGKFNTSVGINHNYTFHFSMDYHATTKVLVSTMMPPEKTKEKVGGIFKFKCEIFERVEGLSMILLRKPIIKIRYVAGKDKFEPDKAYTEKFLWELESFKESLAILKSRRKPVLKKAPPHTTKKKMVEQPKEDYTTQLEEKPKKKKNLNPRGHRNIMDNLKEASDNRKDTAIEVSTDDLATTDENEEPITPIEVKEEELEEPTFVLNNVPSIKVFPKREKIVNRKVKSDAKRNEMREMAISTKNLREESIKEEALQRQILIAKEEEKHLNNKYIQSLRLQGIIKTVASSEKEDLVFRYKQKPILEFEVLPLVTRHFEDGFFVDVETIKVIYPTKKVIYHRKEYLFGFEYYYRNNEEVNYETFCREIVEYDKNMEVCAQ